MTEPLNKEHVLKQITEAASKQLISKKELVAAYDQGLPSETEISRSTSLAQVFSLLGGGIVFLGIAILIGQFWDSYSSSMKIVITLGSGIVAYTMAILFEKKKQVSILNSCFFLLAALLIPLGIFVTFDVAGIDFHYPSLMIWVSLISLAVFLVSFFVFRKKLLLLFSILYATSLAYSIIGYYHPGNLNDIELYATIGVGLSYIFLGRFLHSFPKLAMTGFLYGVGVFLVLGASFALSLDKPVWEFILPLIILSVMYASVKLKSNSFLTFGSLFLVVYIAEETEKHFSKSMGWPLALVLAGLLMIACAYVYIQVKKKFFRLD